MAVYPKYKSEEVKERAQIEVLFSLGGGELNVSGQGDWDELFAYWYEGLPEYDYESEEDQDYDYRTGISWRMTNETAMLVDPATGIEWELVETYRPPTEVDCDVCGAGTGGYFADQFFDQYGREPQADDDCGLCDTEVEDQPGYIYDGYAHEVTYRTHSSNLYPEIYGD